MTGQQVAVAMDASVRQALTALYLQDPCGTESTALWKVWKTPDLRATLNSLNGTLQRLVLETDTLLRTFYQTEPPYALSLGAYETAILHARYLDGPDRTGMVDERYFRLLHDLANTASDRLPGGYAFAPVEMPRQADTMAALISACYGGTMPDAGEVVAWTQSPVFHPDLWVAVIETDGRTPVALGIAELDPQVGEGSLEWIQVLPGHRGRGVGTALVCRLLRLLTERAAFATVSGAMNHSHAAERLYRRCGFKGDDVWHVFIRRSRTASGG
jgi:ribosomal protein S18 acetylase RimI-like enzyme